MTADLLFIQPKGYSDEWVKSRLWQRASGMPSVHAFVDGFGKQAALFKELTSGQVALYDQRGTLVFQGGITASRGQAGDNIGLDSVVAITNGKKPRVSESPVYGCSLVNPAAVRTTND